METPCFPLSTKFLFPPSSRATRQIFGAEPCLLETRYWKRGTHRNFTPKNCTSPRYLLNYKSHVAPLYFHPNDPPNASSIDTFFPLFFGKTLQAPLLAWSHTLNRPAIFQKKKKLNRLLFFRRFGVGGDHRFPSSSALFGPRTQINIFSSPPIPEHAVFPLT